MCVCVCVLIQTESGFHYSSRTTRDEQVWSIHLLAENIDELGAVRWGATGLWRFCGRVRRRPEIRGDRNTDRDQERGYLKRKCWYMKSCKKKKVKVIEKLTRNQKEEGEIKKSDRKKNTEQKKSLIKNDTSTLR